MSVQVRNNVHVSGRGGATMVFSHGFGCDRDMSRYPAPTCEDRFRVITHDLVGSGRSDRSAPDRADLPHRARRPRPCSARPRTEP